MVRRYWSIAAVLAAFPALLAQNQGCDRTFGTVVTINCGDEISGTATIVVDVDSWRTNITSVDLTITDFRGGQVTATADATWIGAGSQGVLYQATFAELDISELCRGPASITADALGRRNQLFGIGLKEVFIAHESDLQVSITSPEDGAVIEGDLTVQVAASGGAAPLSITVEFNGETEPVDPEPGTVTFSTEGLTPGQDYGVTATVTDDIGDTATDSISVVIGGAPPPDPLVVSIDSPAPGAAVTGAFPVTVSTTGGVPDIGIDVTFAGGDPQHIDGPGGTVEFSTVGLTTGDIRLIEATATDSVGQTDSASVGVVVIHPSLLVTIDAPEDLSSVEGPFEVHVSTEGGVPAIGIAVSFADGPPEHIDGPSGVVEFDTAGLVEGEKYPIVATALDSVGQVATASISVVYEDIPFAVSIVRPELLATVNGLFEVEVETVGGAPEVTIDVSFLSFTKTVHNSSGVVTFHAGYASEEGNYVISAWATDGNGEDAWTNIVVHVDPSGDPPPMLVDIRFPHDGDEVSGEMYVFVVVHGGEAPVAIEVTFGDEEHMTDPEGGTSFNTTLVANGPHELTATATDANGMTATETITVIVSN